MNKKIDCWKNLTGETSEHFVTALQFDDEKSYKEAVRYFKESFEFALTKQRSELLEENNKKWKEKIKELELTVDKINKKWEEPEWVWENHQKLIDFTKKLIEETNKAITNLLNKKDE